MTDFKMHTPDLSAQNVEKLLALFPNVATETRDDKGVLVRGIDFDLLRQELSSRIVEGPDERYRLDWPGKREAMLVANAPIAKTLRPCREESVDFDTTKNLFIEGDNLDALKLLQETYLGKVKLIYIDPPYNTGNDFIYEDDFAEDTDTYLTRSNQKDEQGNRLVANTEANGRFHSDWLNMMYPRLKLARNLLRDDGVIFVSIADHEIHTLRSVMGEVFGAENFVATLIWQKVFSPKNSARHFSEDHDYIVVFAKSGEIWKPTLLPRTAEMEARYSNQDNDPRGPWTSGDLSARNYYGDGTYSVTCPSGRVVPGPPPGTYWRVSPRKFKELDADKRIWWGPDGNNQPRLKRFLSDVKDGRVPQTLLTHHEVGHTQEAKKELMVSVDFETSDSVFDTPKPVRLMQRLLQVGTSSNDPEAIVLDFFAGTGTMQAATFIQNLEDGGQRRCIQVQIAEALPGAKTSDSLKTISDITKERIRKVGKSVQESWQTKHASSQSQPDLLDASEPAIDSITPPDVGFRVLKIDTSNFNESFYKKPDEIHQTELLAMVDNIKPDRSAEDLLFQVLLDWGVDLALPIVRESILGKTVYFVNGRSLAACFDKGVDEALIREIAARKPLRVVFRDTSYASDDTKINAVQIFAQLSPTTDVRTV